MIDIAAHISKLVREHELVIIPGLGGFLTNFHHSAIHALSNRIEPPGKHIAFNSHLKENDGLLAHYFAKNADISYKDALSLVETFAEFCLKELNEGRNISFENLGILSLNNKAYIEFSPDLSLNFADEYFGLPDIIATRIIRNKEYKPVIQLHPEAKEKIKHNALAIRKIAAIALPFIMIGLLAFFTKDQIKNIYQQQTSIFSFSNDSSQPENETLELDVSNTDKGIISTPIVAAENTNSEIEKTEESSEIIMDVIPQHTPGQFHIICGAFSSKKLADDLILKLEAEGFEPYIAGQNKIGLYRVSFANFNNRTKAVNQLRWFQSNRNKDAWLLNIEL